MEMKLLILFVVMNIVNVVIQTNLLGKCSQSNYQFLYII